MPQKTKVMTLVVLLTIVCLFLILRYGRERSNYQPRMVPVVSSTQMAGTAIVPTLDTPLGKSGNAIWCATFQVAWNHARDDVVGGPLSIANAQPVATRLNESPVSEMVLPPGNYFAAAGRLEDGIVDTIRQQMAERFPGVNPPSFEEAVGFVAYGYLDSKVKFTTPFVDTKQPLQFLDATGVEHSVSGFGLHEGTDWDLLAKQAAQVKVLFSQTDDESDWANPSAFALDLTADHTEQQVIIAVLPRAAQLCVALDDLARRINEYAPDEHSAQLQDVDTLRIPNVVFHINHEFAELQGVDKIITNPGEFQGLHIEKAFQSIQFRLDKSGAVIISEAYEYPAAAPRHFIVDRPFLIVMKRRSTDEPYFAAWIDNAELLEVIQKANTVTTTKAQNNIGIQGTPLTRRP